MSSESSVLGKGSNGRWQRGQKRWSSGISTSSGSAAGENNLSCHGPCCLVVGHGVFLAVGLGRLIFLFSATYFRFTPNKLLFTKTQLGLELFHFLLQAGLSCNGLLMHFFQYAFSPRSVASSAARAQAKTRMKRPWGGVQRAMIRIRGEGLQQKRNLWRGGLLATPLVLFNIGKHAST